MRFTTPLAYSSTIVIIPVIIFISCVHYEPFETRDYLIFGELTLDCTDDCTLLFRLDRYSLRIDDETDGFIKSEYRFSDRALHPDLRATASILADVLPEKLVALHCEVLGEPSRRNGSALLVVQKQDGFTRQWLIDTNELRLPMFIIPFKRAIEEVLIRLTNR